MVSGKNQTTGRSKTVSRFKKNSRTSCCLSGRKHRKKRRAGSGFCKIHENQKRQIGNSPRTACPGNTGHHRSRKYLRSAGNISEETSGTDTEYFHERAAAPACIQQRQSTADLLSFRLPLWKYGLHSGSDGRCGLFLSVSGGDDPG